MQAWRVLTAPDTLCSRVLRARYFKNGGFMTANCPKSASFTWRSIVHGRDLLKEGLIWRIGDGGSVDVWEDSWIPRAGLKRPLGHRPNTKVQKVKELLLSDGRGWNEDKLNELFFEGDVTDILKVPVGRAEAEDYIAWNYTKNRIFSVKSAYHLKMQLNQRQKSLASSSNSCDEHRGWLALWEANVPGKAKIHVWRLIKNGLAVGVELQRMSIKEGVQCIVCNRAESLLHRFWHCPHSAAAWEFLREQTGLQLPGPDVPVRTHRELQGWCLDWLGRLADKELSISVMLLYQLWLARNDAREDLKMEDPRSVGRRSIMLVEEWLGLKDTPKLAEPAVVERWLPPEQGWHKINADGAFSMVSGHEGTGVVLRNHHGEFLAGECRFLTSVSDPERAELLACKQALVLAKEMQVGKVCLGAVAKIQSGDKDRSVHGPLVEEIKLMLKDFAEAIVRHARRCSNGVAHHLAKEGCSNKMSKTWVGAPPEWLVNLLATECAA